MNRDRGKWVGPLKGVHVTMYTAWHARAVLLWTAAIKTTCQFHSFVDGHPGYSQVLGWEEKEKQQVNGKRRNIHPKGSRKVTSSEIASLSHLLPLTSRPKITLTRSNWRAIFLKFEQFLQLLLFSEESKYDPFKYDDINNHISAYYFALLLECGEVELCAKAVTGFKGKTIAGGQGVGGVEEKGKRKGSIRGERGMSNVFSSNLIQCFIH